MDDAARRTPGRVGSVIRAACGNFLEMYDFTIFGYYAASIGATFFPGGKGGDAQFLSIMLSLMTFGAGFLMRPIGALVLGSYIDRHGRRAGLILTLALMSVGTAAIAVLPGYATIGLLAPLLVLISRLIQGFSAGAELGGVSVYLSEIATPGNKGFYVSWQSGSQQVAVVFAALLGLVSRHHLGDDAVAAWGWRIPLLVGCAIIPIVFVIRNSLVETDAFQKGRAPHSLREVAGSILSNWRLVLTGMGLVVLTTVSFYMITVYTPTFGKRVLHLTDTQALAVTVCTGLSNLFWLPIGGALSDRIGRTPILLGCSLASLVLAYPVMSWLVGHPAFANLLMVELYFSLIYGLYNGAMVVHLTEIMPESVRTSGFSMAYSLATILGGMTPAICTYFIERTHNGAFPGLWLSLAGGIALIATIITSRGERRPAASDRSTERRRPPTLA